MMPLQWSVLLEEKDEPGIDGERQSNIKCLYGGVAAVNSQVK